MTVNDYGKMIMQVLVLIAVTVLAVTHTVTGDFVQVIIGAMVGYLFGNGVNAVRKTPPSPMLAPSPKRITDDATTDNTAG